MDSESVFANLDYLGSSGIVLSVEQKASLQSSLVTLKREHKFRRVKLWGVIRGIQSDYFIIQGVGKDEIKDRKALFRYKTKKKEYRHLLKKISPLPPNLLIDDIIIL